MNATVVIGMLSYLLCKSSLASEIAVRDYVYHNKIYFIFMFSTSCINLNEWFWNILIKRTIVRFMIYIYRV